MPLYMKVATHEAELILGLRLRLSVPGPLQRVVPPEGTIIDGHFVPGGVLSVLDLINCRLL